jgi:hypothetical protein
MSVVLVLFVGPIDSWLTFGVIARIWHLLFAIVLGVLVYAIIWFLMGLRLKHFRPN